MLVKTMLCTLKVKIILTKCNMDEVMNYVSSITLLLNVFIPGVDNPTVSNVNTPDPFMLDCINTFLFTSVQ